MRLLQDTLRHSHPLPVVRLTGLIHQDEIDTAQGRRRCPRYLAICAPALITQYIVYRVHLHILDTVHLRKLRLEGVYQLPSGAYNEDPQTCLRRSDSHLKQYRGFARARAARYEEAAPVLALQKLVVQGYSVGHRTEGLFLAR